MAVPAVRRTGRSKCWNLACSARLTSRGREIADPQELLEEAERVAAVILRNPHANCYIALMVDGWVLPALAAVEESYAGDRRSALGTLPDSGLMTARRGVEDLTIKRFGLCSEHARRVARAFIMARLYTDSWPDSPPPLAPVFYEAGRVTKTQPWTPWAIAALLRLWAVGGLSITAFRSATHALHKLAYWRPVEPEDIEAERKPGYPSVALRFAVALLAKNGIAPMTDAAREAVLIEHPPGNPSRQDHPDQLYGANARQSAGSNCSRGWAANLP